MSRFGFLAPQDRDPPNKPRSRRQPRQAESPLELDEELFSALGAQLGGENEALRNMLLDANNKINELDTIKAAVGKLVDPVSKALRDFETEKSEKVGLQTVLNNTRTAYGKLRNEVADLEKKLAASEQRMPARCARISPTTQNLLRTAGSDQGRNLPSISPPAARRSPIWKAISRRRPARMQGAARGEPPARRAAASPPKSASIALESDLGAARQRLLMADDEKRAQQSLLDKASTEAARLSRKLAETEASFNAVQGRLRHVEGEFQRSLHRARPPRHRPSTRSTSVTSTSAASQRMRFEALQARAAAPKRCWPTRASICWPAPRRSANTTAATREIAAERDDLQARVTDLEAAADRRANPNSRKPTRPVRLLWNATRALARALTAKEAALDAGRGHQRRAHSRVGALEAGARPPSGRPPSRRSRNSSAALRREKLERAVVEGALDTARKDFSRASMRE